MRRGLVQVPALYPRQSVLADISGGMVEIYQHQALWDNRQYPKVHQAFAEIWGDEKLWVSLDRANMKPPAREDRPEWCNKGMIHWDVDTTQQPVAFGVQGVLYLTDTAEDQGGFQCVPGFHRMFDEWVKTQPADRNTRKPNLTGLTVESIAGQAGDLLIWHRLLAHGNGHNRSDSAALGAVYHHVASTRERRSRAPGADHGLAGAATDAALARRCARLGTPASAASRVDRSGAETLGSGFVGLKPFKELFNE